MAPPRDIRVLSIEVWTMGCRMSRRIVLSAICRFDGAAELSELTRASMRRWFLSYHSPDQALAERLKVAIERSDADSRVFFAPTSMRAGGSWTAQLAHELAEAHVFILLVGKAGVGDWQVPEYDEALDRWVKSGRTFPLVVVLLEGQKAPGLPFLRQL